MSMMLLSGAMAQNCGKVCDFAAILGRLQRSTNENYRTFSARLGDFFAQRASLSQIFRSKGALGCNFSALHGALDAILRYNCGQHGEKLGVAGGSALAAAHEGWWYSNATAGALTTTSVAVYGGTTRTMRLTKAAGCDFVENTCTSTRIAG
jgi:hypothetical protein